MKISLPFFIFLAMLLSASLSAQKDFYFADSSAQWNVLGIEKPFGSGNRYGTNVYKADGDVQIRDNQYQQITNAGNHFYVRRDLSSRIYFRDATDTTEFIIYDFSKVKGDSYFIYNPWLSIDSKNAYVTVDSTDTVYWDIPRKRMFLCVTFSNSPVQCNNPLIVCVDGIGALNSHFLYPGQEYDYPGAVEYSTLCFLQHDTVVYHDINYSACLLDSVATGMTQVIGDNSICISPNPASTGFVTIQLNENTPYKTFFQLFDVTGRMILQRSLSAKLNRIDLTGISQGMYLCNIISPNQKIYSGKLVVQ